MVGLEIGAKLGNRLRKCTDKTAVRFRDASLVFVILMFVAGGVQIDGFGLKPTHFTVGYVVFLTAGSSCVIAALMAQNRADRRSLRVRNGQCIQCGHDLHDSKRRCSICNATIKPMIAYPAVVRFLRDYFWRYWPKDADSDIEILNQALEQEPELEVFQITNQLDALLAQGFSEEELALLMQRKIRCFFEPAGIGMTRVEWLAFVQQTLSEKYAHST